MSLISVPFTFTVGQVIVASQHNSCFSTIYADYNGNIQDVNIASNAAISDSKLAQITTAAKVSGAALTDLDDIPSGANAVPLKNGGTGRDLATLNQGDIYYDNGSNGFTRLTPGTSGQVLKTNGSAANPSYGNALASVSDYGSSASTATARQATAIKVAFGSAALSSGTLTITNLPFTNNTSYTITGTLDTDSGTQSQAITVIRSSGAQAVFTDSQSTNKIVHWFAIGT